MKNLLKFKSPTSPTTLYAYLYRSYDTSTKLFRIIYEQFSISLLKGLDDPAFPVTPRIGFVNAVRNASNNSITYEKFIRS